MRLWGKTLGRMGGTRPGAMLTVTELTAQRQILQDQSHLATMTSCATQGHREDSMSRLKQRHPERSVSNTKKCEILKKA